MADPFAELDRFFSCSKGLWDCLPTKPITTKHQSVLVSQPITAYVGHMHWHLLVDITCGGLCWPCGQHRVTHQHTHYCHILCHSVTDSCNLCHQRHPTAEFHASVTCTAQSSPSTVDVFRRSWRHSSHRTSRQHCEIRCTLQRANKHARYIAIFLDLCISFLPNTRDTLSFSRWPQKRRKIFPEFSRLFQSHKLTFP